MKRLFIIRGIPGSGKSTLAKLLCTNHFEADMWFEKHGGYNPARLTDAHAWCADQAQECMRKGEDVAVSNTFTQKWEMSRYHIMAECYGYKVFQLIANGDFQNIHSVPDHVVERMKKRFEVF